MDFSRLAWLMDHVPYRHAPQLREDLGPARLILDVGGGTGRIARRLPERRVLVLDAEGRMLQRARRKGLDTIRADAAHLPLHEGTLDAVLLVDAFHHLPDQERAMTESQRVLKEGGHILIEEFDPRSLTGRLVERAEAILKFRSTFHEPRQLLERLGEGWTRKEIRRRNRRDYALVAAKSRDSRPTGEPAPSTPSDRA